MDQRAAFDATVRLARERNMEAKGVHHPASVLSLEHLLDMQARITPEFSEAKLGRWLGWAQAALVAANVGVTLDDVKAINKAHADTPEPHVVTREQVREALWNFPENAISLATLDSLAERGTGDYSEVRDYLDRQVDAILALLPAPAPRATVTREQVEVIVANVDFGKTAPGPATDAILALYGRPEAVVTEAQLYSLAESYAYDRYPDRTVQEDPEVITEVGMSLMREWLERAGITIENGANDAR